MIKYTDFELINVATGLRVSIPTEDVYKWNVDDKITPNYNESTGYGKFDPIVVYKNTTRTVTTSISLKGAYDYSHLMKDFALITLPKYSKTDATVIYAAPIYHLNLFGYFKEYGVIKDLQVKPSFEARDIAFYSSEPGDMTQLNPDLNYHEYGFIKLDINFSFTVLHKETPNVDSTGSLKNWPFAS